jgi:hypothetical protein
MMMDRIRRELMGTSREGHYWLQPSAEAGLAPDDEDDPEASVVRVGFVLTYNSPGPNADEPEVGLLDGFLFDGIDGQIEAAVEPIVEHLFPLDPRDSPFFTKAEPRPSIVAATWGWPWHGTRCTPSAMAAVRHCSSRSLCSMRSTGRTASLSNPTPPS